VVVSGKTSIVAKALVHSGALKFGSFKLKSGVMSPYYIDLTWLLSSPLDFGYVINAVAEEIEPMVASGKVNKLASIELKGALLAPSIAGKLRIPCLVVRKESKTYGVTDRIAGGEVKKGDRIVFFDDVITSGASKVEGIKLLEQAGATIEAVVVVVDREQGGRQELEKQGYKVKPVTTISEIAKNLVSAKALSVDKADDILEYIGKP
jgi:orotate phosphoribosyltransferase